jgi:hypothetical protein
MANRAFASLWCRRIAPEGADQEGLAEQAMLVLLEGFLATVPLSEPKPGFTSLVIRAVGPGETPLVDWPLGSRPLAGVIEVARQHLHADCCCEVQAHWDLWSFDAEAAAWRLTPQPLEIAFHGQDYDDGVFEEAGHIQVRVGFEHLFTGHAGLLGLGERRAAAPEHPAEAAFLGQMSAPEKLREYQARTRENIQKLHAWMQRAQELLPVERFRLWSEGEENFEARMDEILAVR